MDATIYARAQVSDQKDRKKLLKDLRADGFSITDLSDNELAKLHICHMVGGRTAGLENEVIYRLEWPDSSGSLAVFLTLLEPDWNISILHFRKTGGTYAYVCIGLQMPPEKIKNFESRMDQARYIYIREENNPACKLFLS